MAGVSIGITAMELFAYNPFRILGIPVNATHAEINAQYEKLTALANSGEITNYSTPFDFDSLPPFERSTQMLKTAHTKLASNGYRCFAYADGQFTVSLSIDDIMLNLRDISCYDCFLRCYMWLVINDREMAEHDLWIMLANYIDMLIMSQPDEWTKYFDNRFPAEMVDESMHAYKSFYSTFCEIILLPLKEMVRGSMKCRSAKEILECAGIDVNEQFEPIDIPQANAPKAGEPAPKLKLALKYGDEYFDISTGTMRSYSEDTAANEANMFSSEHNAPLNADVLSEPDEEPAPEEEYAEEPAAPQTVYEEPAPQQPAEPAPAPQQFIRSRAEKRSAEKEPAADKPEKPTLTPTELVAPKVEPLTLDDAVEAAPAITPRTSRTAPAAAPAPEPRQAPAPAKPAESAPRQRRSFSASTGAPKQQSRSGGFKSPFMNMSPAADENKAVSNPTRKQNAFANVVAEAAEAEKEAMSEDLRYEGEDEETYTNALVEILKSSTSRGESMKSVDTSHVVSAKEMAGPSHTTASMDDIDLKKYDAKLLSSQVNAERRMTREERYRNIKIDDMLGNSAAQGKNYGMSAIDEYKKNKEAERKSFKSLMGAIGFMALVAVILLALFWFGIL